MKSTFLQVVDLADDIKVEVYSQITSGRVTPTVPRLAKAKGLLYLYLVKLWYNRTGIDHGKYLKVGVKLG